MDGAIKVDEYSNTNIKGIYAIGDVTNRVCLTPVAIREGRILAERIFNSKPTLKMNYKNIATVIFSHPTIGVIGDTEVEAREKYGSENVKIYKSSFINMFYSPGQSDRLKLKSLFKLVCANTGDTAEKVVGVHAIGKGVDEMMQGISIAVNMGASKEDFDSSVAIHPTAAEEWVTIDPKFNTALRRRPAQPVP